MRHTAPFSSSRSGPVTLSGIAVPSVRGNPGATKDASKAVEGLFRDRAEEIAAMVVEPLVQAVSGMVVHPPGYLRKLADLCKRYDILLIVDEVATGFGRTGRMFACDHEDVTPDLLCLAKGITGGYLPLAATLTTPDVFEAFLGDYAERKTFFHGHTYTGNPLGCAAALANIEMLRREGFWEDLEIKIELFSEGLQTVRDLPHVGEVRQCGFMVGIELVKDRKSREPYPWEEQVGVRVCDRARNMGLLIRPLSHVIVLMPPLGIVDSDLNLMVEITHQAIREVTGP